jgi:hypothetical protein
MNFTLNVLDKLYNPIDVSNLTLKSEVVSITDAITHNVSGLTLEPGNTYDIVFPADATTDPFSTSTVTFPEDAALNFNLAAGELTAGVTKQITVGATPITNFTIGVVSVAADTYDATVLVQGEDITITIDGNVNTGVNSATESVTNGDTITISVVIPGYFTYTNNVKVYNEDLNVDVNMIENITDPNDPEYREPFPLFFIVRDPCTYCAYVYNASNTPFGMVAYDETGDVFSNNWNDTICACTPDILSITQTVVVRAVQGCGGTSPIIFNKSWTHPSYTIDEYKPSLTLEDDLSCCVVPDEELVVSPATLELLFVAPRDECADMELVYTLTSPSGIITTTTFNHAALIGYATLDDLNFTHTPTELGTYTLNIALTNCCDTTEYDYSFDACNSWSITNSECNDIVITNLSTLTDLTYTIKELGDFEAFENITYEDIEQENIVLCAGASVTISGLADNLYTITVIDEHPTTVDVESIFLLDCNIKKCKKDFLLDLLCAGTTCDTLEDLERAKDFVQFKTLEEIVYKFWDEWKQQQSLVETFSINDIMQDVLIVSEALDAIKKICDLCGTNGEDCGCN